MESGKSKSQSFPNGKRRQTVDQNGQLRRRAPRSVNKVWLDNCTDEELKSAKIKRESVGQQSRW